MYLPVNVAGGLLSMGDLHAAMGTAEPTSVSLEAAGQATLRVGLEPAMRAAASRGCAAAARRSSWASPRASPRRTRWRSIRRYDHLVDERGIDPFEAYALISARCDMRLGGPAAAIVMAVLPDD